MSEHIAQLLRDTAPPARPRPSPPFPGEPEWAARALHRAGITDFQPTATAQTDRAWVALMLATTPETWHALLQGRPVSHRAIDQTQLRRMRTLQVLP